MTLVARTRRLDTPVDLLAVAGADGWLFERNRVGLAGRGAALRVDWPAADPAAGAGPRRRRWPRSRSTTRSGLPGCGPVAFGALPFVPGAGAT